ncbi:MAG TPA: DNA primase [bacterium]|nr:DNA primase [bacterium]
MFSSSIEEIKSKLDIVEVISSYIKLIKAGANYKALCPFHGEKTPSLFVSPSRQMWHCFGCSEGHSIFDFVMKIEGVEFGDALRILAHKAGVELKPIKPELRTKRQRFYEICELATKFYEKQLEKSSKGKEIKEYLLKRGINEESIKKWRLGWAPDAWRSLAGFLGSQNYSLEETQKAGLSIKGEKGSYDRFRSRIMFPVFDLNSQVIGFGGRVLKKEKELAKYMNTPNTLLYDKSKILYGLNKSKIEIRKNDFCVLVEGYIDVILAHQEGKANVVATAGTALTPFQLAILKRYSSNLRLAFDMDFAGDAATKRGIDLARARGFDIKVVKMPEGKDPADIISKDAEEFGKLVNNAVSILDFHFQNAFSQFDKKTAEGKRKISNILLPVIKGVLNKIEQASWVQELATQLNVKEKDIEIELKKVKIEEASNPVLEVNNFQKQVAKKTKKQVLEERLLTLLLKFPQHLSSVDKEIVPYFSSQTQEIINNFENLDKISTEFSNIISTLSLRAEVEQIEEEEILPELEFCLKEIKTVELKKKLDDVSLQIRQAEQAQDIKKIEDLNQEFNQLTKKIITN